MLEIYGSQWEREYGHVDGAAFPTWSTALVEMTVEQLRRGLDALILEGSDFPPNLIKFLRLCRNGNPTDSYPYRNRTPAKALPRKAARYSVKRIEQAKQKLLTGQVWGTMQPSAKDVMDWGPDDEELLFKTLETFVLNIPGESPRQQVDRLNAHVDSVEFSHGSQWRSTH